MTPLKGERRTQAMGLIPQNVAPRLRPAVLVRQNIRRSCLGTKLFQVAKQTAATIENRETFTRKPPPDARVNSNAQHSIAAAKEMRVRIFGATRVLR